MKTFIENTNQFVKLQTRAKTYEQDIIGSLVYSTEKHKIELLTQLEDTYFIFYTKLFLTVKKLVTSDRSITDYLQQKNYPISEILEWEQRNSTNSEVLRKIKTLAQISKELNLYSLCVDTIYSIDGNNGDKKLSAHHEKLLELSQDKKTTKSLLDGYKFIDEMKQDYSDKRERGIELLGLDCGYPRINKIIDGLRQSHLWIVGGYTSTGKTFFALNILNSLINQKKRSMFISLEMTMEDILNRVLTLQTGVTTARRMKYPLSTENQQKEVEAREKIVKSETVIYTQLREFEKMRLGILRENSIKKLDCIFIDYAQLIMMEGKTEYEALKYIAQSLQELAKELNIPIVLLSQVSNAHAQSGNTQMLGYKGAGTIGDSADLGLELKLDTDDNGSTDEVEIKCYIKKNRHGEKGMIKFNFNKPTGEFTEINEDDF